MEKDIVAIIMAGGLGSRMNSNIPKVLHKLNKLPLIVHILLNLEVFSKRINLKQILIVVGKYRVEIQNTIEEYIKLPYITYVQQDEPKGTGHAVKCCSNELLKYNDCDVIVLSGDVPFFSPQSMFLLTQDLNNVKIVVTEMENPHGYGRIITDNYRFLRIKEHNDCSIDELNIQKVNCGIYSFNVNILLKWISNIKNNNAKEEYYLTDIIELIKEGENIDIEMIEIPIDKHYEILGINTIEQLEMLERTFYNT
jgi:bifunctional N-acetylglucosamine-1-phosphate-uridyltransferase/glucosamine-1-phosphate-acetyltransferase GlmU-like protein